MSHAITLNELEAAINRARTAQPASGAESSLGRDVSVLAGLYGRMIWERLERLDTDEISAPERAALNRWRAASGPGASA